MFKSSSMFLMSDFMLSISAADALAEQSVNNKKSVFFMLSAFGWLGVV